MAATTFYRMHADNAVVLVKSLRVFSRTGSMVYEAFGFSYPITMGRMGRTFRDEDLG